MTSRTFSDIHPITGYKRNFNHNHDWTITARPQDTMTAQMRRAGTPHGYRYNDHFHLNEVNTELESVFVDPEPLTLKQAQTRRRKLGARRNGRRIIVRKCQTDCGKEPLRKKHAKAYTPANAYKGSDLAAEHGAQQAPQKARPNTKRDAKGRFVSNLH